MATRRLQKEWASNAKNPLDYCTFNLVGDDIHHWEARLSGPSGTPYAGGTFVVDLDFPAQYPFKAPKIRFVTPVYHPNVKTDTGEICGDLIEENWGPTLNVRHCAGVLRGVLESPEPDHPLEPEIASQMRERPGEFEKAVVRHVREHAMK
uniref:UBC core domain-containing protein n=1 Tax=Odontella aurita TaxID=265563 RepID=A0A7S4JR19_9STRA|mmetsp:Transcript_51894/g.155753  ORF Transcript_51894/g.155753 Transcript_51894/m.155753 type:complete len:150 (+) Transcript_51894:175-624(+)